MIPASLKVMPKQERKILKALQGRKGCKIKVKNQSGADNMLLTHGHLKRIHKAARGSVVTLPFSHRQLVENSRHEGGFLPLLAAILGPVLGGVAGGLLSKGKGLTFGKKKKKKTDKKAGNGMYLNPWRGGRKQQKSGQGMYLKPWRYVKKNNVH